VHQPSTVAYRWERIDSSEVDSWNETLLKTSAPYYQYPFWNEPYRLVKLSPIYLACEHESARCAYLCILSLGLPGYRIGLVLNGPVNLNSHGPVETAVLESLKDWAGRNGFVFLRFAHLDSELIDRVLSLPSAKRENAFPFFGGVNQHALLVELRESEEEMLAGFQTVARYEIRAAGRIGYEISVSDRAEDFAEAWPVFQALAKRKGFSLYRPMAGWMDLMRRASPLKGARLYTARLGSKIVQAILVVRDARIAEYVLGASNVDAMPGNISPGCLLHWRAMRESYQLGCKYYDLGPPSGVVYQFKRKFRPVARMGPPPVTLVTRPVSYWLWSRMLLRTIVPLWPRVRSVVTWAVGSCRPR